VTILTGWLIRTKFSKKNVLLHFFEQVVLTTKIQFVFLFWAGGGGGGGGGSSFRYELK
jgi:hypothetical protein